ncbi:MAG: DNA-deoxyinosine glycosylase, partial [Methanospirillum sp.]|nr:DNA-deoxyinosine glycosylase [Methanospirillum sp.]
MFPDPGDDSHYPGLPPVISPGCRILILGSYPSIVSLKTRRYYANPRNGFWTIMDQVLGIPASLPYDDRIRSVLDQGIGLWDVYASCTRRSSSDATIRDPVVNSIRELTSIHPRISALFLNGRAAEKGFRVYFPDLIPQGHYLPSSSHAHAISLDKKI